jgi:hypothetical protein
MRTDLKLNYMELENVKVQIDRFHDAIDDIEVTLTELENLLQEQESEAIYKLTERVGGVKTTMDSNKAALSDLSNIVGRYIAEMSDYVGASPLGAMTRTDRVSIGKNLWDMSHSINRAVSSANLLTPVDFIENWGITPEEETRRRLIMAPNFSGLDNYRRFTFVPAMSTVEGLLENMNEIQNNKIIPYENLDDTFRSELNNLYTLHIDKRTRDGNSWNLFLSVSGAFLRSLAEATLKVLVVVVTVKALVAAGPIGWIILVTGVVALIAIPRDSVPDVYILTDVFMIYKDAVDGVVGLLTDPVNTLGAIGQGFMDTIQTPEGIASVSGSSVVLVAGGWKAYRHISGRVRNVNPVSIRGRTGGGQQIPRASDLNMSNTVRNHANDLVRRGPNRGLPSRPYVNSNGTNMLLDEIMGSKHPVRDVILDNGLRWDVPGTFRGKAGTWELVVDMNTNTIVHFNFVR